MLLAFTFQSAISAIAVSTVWLRRAEYGNHPDQHGLGTGADVHRFCGEPDDVDADHRVSPQTRRAQLSGSDVGYFTVSV